MEKGLVADGFLPSSEKRREDRGKRARVWGVCTPQVRVPLHTVLGRSGPLVGVAPLAAPSHWLTSWVGAARHQVSRPRWQTSQHLGWRNSTAFALWHPEGCLNPLLPQSLLWKSFGQTTDPFPALDLSWTTV